MKNGKSPLGTAVLALATTAILQFSSFADEVAPFVLTDGAVNTLPLGGSWTGGVITGLVTSAATTLQIPSDFATGPEGLTIQVFGSFKPALTVTTDGTAARTITMNGPLHLWASDSSKEEKDFPRLTIGPYDSDPNNNVNLDWGQNPARIFLDSNSYTILNNLKCKGLYLKGNPVSSGLGSATCLEVNGLNAAGGPLILDGATIGRNWGNATDNAWAGGTQIQGGVPERVVLKHQGGFYIRGWPNENYEDWNLFMLDRAYMSVGNSAKSIKTLTTVGINSIFLEDNLTISELKSNPGDLMIVSQKQRATNKQLCVPKENLTVIGGGAEEHQKPIVHGFADLQAFTDKEAFPWGRTFGDLYVPRYFMTYDDEGKFLTPNIVQRSDWTQPEAVAEWTKPGELDNMNVSENLTLTEDMTINSLAGDSVTLDLGGHSLTVKSGMIRSGRNPFHIKNGTLTATTKAPLMFVQNGESNLSASFVTDASTPEDPVATLFCAGANYVSAKLTVSGDNSAAKGLFYLGGFYPVDATFYFTQSAIGPQMTLEGGLGATFECSQYAPYQAHAMLGFKEIYLKGSSSMLLGEGETPTGAFTVGKNGYLTPGFADENNTRMKESTIKAGSGQKFQITDGELRVCVVPGTGNSSLKLEGFTGGVELGGSLVVSGEFAKDKDASFVILRSDNPISGKFINVSEGWAAKNEMLDDGSYAVVLSKKERSTLILIY